MSQHATPRFLPLMNNHAENLPAEVLKLPFDVRVFIFMTGALTLFNITSLLVTIGTMDTLWNFILVMTVIDILIIKPCERHPGIPITWQYYQFPLNFKFIVYNILVWPMFGPIYESKANNFMWASLGLETIYNAGILVHIIMQCVERYRNRDN